MFKLVNLIVRCKILPKFLFLFVAMTADSYSSFDSKSIASNAPKDIAGYLESEDFFLKNITTPVGYFSTDVYVFLRYF